MLGVRSFFVGLLALRPASRNLRCTVELITSKLFANKSLILSVLGVVFHLSPHRPFLFGDTAPGSLNEVRNLETHDLNTLTV